MAKSILVVDDELDFSELLQFRLRESGHKLLFATNGAQALNQARQHLPDVILMDLLLPDLDGLTLCEILRRQLSTRDTPVIMISAMATDVTRHSATLAGACAFFAKPLDFDALNLKIKAVLESPASHLGVDDVYA